MSLVDLFELKKDGAVVACSARTTFDFVGGLAPTHSGGTVTFALGQFLCWAYDVAAPNIYQATDTTPGVTGEVLTAHAQDVNSAAAASTGGVYFSRGGDGLGATDIGGNWVARPGHGVATHGALELQDASAAVRFRIDTDGDVGVSPPNDFAICPGGVERLFVSATDVFVGAPSLRFGYAVAAPAVGQESNDLGHGVAPATLSIGAQNNTHADTPLTGNVALTNPLGLMCVTTAQRGALTAVAGLTVYDTDLTQICVYNGAAWRKVTDAAA
jgi:hypothetical protein